MRVIIISFLILTISLVQAKTIVFINGGPGFNSEPERNILGPHLNKLGHEAFFWDEPSELRPDASRHFSDNAFENATENAGLFIKNICEAKTAAGLSCELTLVAHSFAVHHAVRLAEKYPNILKEIILISPALNIAEADKNILLVAVKGLLEEGKAEASAQLAAMLPTLGEAFDTNKAQAFIIASGYASLFVNYWTDMNLMQQYFSFLQGEYIFDANGMFAVRGGVPKVNQNPFAKISIPVKAYFGAADPITLPEQQLPLLYKYFTKVDTHVLSDARHYPHIERLNDIKY